MIGSRTGSKNGRRADTHAQGRYLPPGYDAIAKPRAPRSGGGEGLGTRGVGVVGGTIRPSG